MSDSDCSNCPKHCEFYEYSYNCYRSKVIQIQKNMTKEDIELIRKVKERLDFLNEQEQDFREDDDFLNISASCQNIIDCFEHKLK